MASFMTNRGAYLMADTYFRGASAPTTFYLALLTNDTPPTTDSNTLGDVSEIATGNGYSSGGIAVARSSAGFDGLTQDDTNNLAELIMVAKAYTASGGSLPASGNGARWAALTDDNATVNSRQILAVFDLTSDRSVSDTQALTVDNSELNIDVG